jgi:serine/threonine protein phosphatase PrpC
MSVCRSCGKRNRDGAGFCRYCGQLLNPGDDTEKPSHNESSPLSQDEAVTLPFHPELEVETSLSPEPDGESALNPASLDEDPAGGNSSMLALAALAQDRGADPEGPPPEESEVVPEHPLPPGHVFQGRYRILEVSSQEEDCTIYEVEDLLKCWNCDHLQTTTEEVFCENCGAALDQKPVVCLRETIIPELAVDGDQPDSIFEEGGYLYQLEPRTKVASDLLPPVFQLLAGYQSDTGGTRDLDEDSLLVLQVNALSELQGLPALNFFAVADGIGGHEAGEVASRITVRSLAAKILENIYSPEIVGQPLSPGELKAQLKEAVLAANQELLSAREQRGVDMGNTLTAALVRDDQAFIVNVGDSRTYLMRMGTLSQITQDHSIVARLLSQNLIQPEEVYTHEQKSVIYRSLGDKPDLEIDDSLFEITLEPGDRLVLCCDGLWEMVPESFMEDVLLEFFDPQAACDKLVEMANQAGGDDNISVIVVNVQTLKRFHQAK